MQCIKKEVRGGLHRGCTFFHAAPDSTLDAAIDATRRATGAALSPRRSSAFFSVPLGRASGKPGICKVLKRHRDERFQTQPPKIWLISSLRVSLGASNTRQSRICRKSAYAGPKPDERRGRGARADSGAQSRLRGGLVQAEEESAVSPRTAGQGM